MVSGAAILSYLVLVLLITVSPGPDTALVVRNRLRLGRRAGLVTALGCASGLLVWGVAAALGVTGLAIVSPTALIVVRLAGAVYLAVLGLLFIRHAARRDPMARDRPAAGSPRARGTFWQGLANNLLNPKAAAFFTAVIPQFVGHGGAPLVATMMLATIAAAASLAGLAVYGAAAARIAPLVRGSGAARWMDGLAGAVMIGFGLRLALERR